MGGRNSGIEKSGWKGVDGVSIFGFVGKSSGWRL